MPRSKTQEATEIMKANAGNEGKPPQAEIDAAIDLLQRWSPKSLHHSVRIPGPKVTYQCKFCHVKKESNDDDVRCPRGCHDEGRSTMEAA